MNETQLKEATTPAADAKMPASKPGLILGSASAAEISPLSVSPDLLIKMDAWWRAANYLNIGQIYLMTKSGSVTIVKFDLHGPLLRERGNRAYMSQELRSRSGT